MSNEETNSLLYLWEHRTLYIGEVSELSPVDQGASSLIVGVLGISPPNTANPFVPLAVSIL